MATVYFVQHGVAESKDIDASRPLAQTGSDATKKMATHLGKHGIIVHDIFHSGKLRAQQTATIFAEVLKELEHDLHGVVAFVILPVFAFANSGISLKGVGLEQLLHPVPLGIAAGLFLGKQLGVFAFCWLGIKLGITKLPEGINWSVLYGASIITGIGFTMSLFIGSLSFEESGVNLLFDERLGIIVGSLLSAVSGYLLLKRFLPANQQ